MAVAAGGDQRSATPRERSKGRQTQRQRKGKERKETTVMELKQTHHHHEHALAMCSTVAFLPPLVCVPPPLPPAVPPFGGIQIGTDRCVAVWGAATRSDTEGEPPPHTHTHSHAICCSRVASLDRVDSLRFESCACGR